MTIENRRQLENTRTKLRELEQICAKIEQASASDEHVRDLTLRSLKKRIKQSPGLKHMRTKALRSVNTA